MRLILALLTLLLLFSGQVLSSVSFESASLFDQLWNLPFEAVSAETIRSYSRGSIKVEEIYYQSRLYKEKAVRIFGYFCYPRWTKKQLPAILLVHGGGGSAHLERSIGWANRGYAVLSIDLPGKGEQRFCSRSSGPDMDVPVLFRTKPDLTSNYLVHAVAAARNAITYLTRRKEVDAERIAMVGLSWGGVITLLTNGQDQRLKTAVNVFGAGYISEACTWQGWFDKVLTQEEADLWNSFIDPKNFLKTQHAPILFITGTNDHCYYLPTFQKSYEEVTAPKKLYLVPNLKHRFLADTQRVVFSWLDSKLKHDGSFPQVTLFPIFKKENQKLIVPVVATASSNPTMIGNIKQVTLYHTRGQPSRWTKKNWESLSAYYENGVHYFSIPLSLINPDLMFFVTAKDSTGGRASSLVRSIFKVNLASGDQTFAVSSPIKKVNKHGGPFQIIGLGTAPEPAHVYFSKKNNTYHLLDLKKSSL